MSDFSLKYEGVIVPPDVEALGPIAVVDYVKSAPDAPADPKILAKLDADAAQHEARYPARASAEKVALAKAKADKAADAAKAALNGPAPKEK